MSDYSAAIYGLIAFASVVTAGVVYVLAQPSDLPSVKKVRSWAWPQHCYPSHTPLLAHLYCCRRFVAWLWHSGSQPGQATEPVWKQLTLNCSMKTASSLKRNCLLFASAGSTVILCRSVLEKWMVIWWKFLQQLQFSPLLLPLQLAHVRPSVKKINSDSINPQSDLMNRSGSIIEVDQCWLLHSVGCWRCLTWVLLCLFSLLTSCSFNFSWLR